MSIQWAYLFAPKGLGIFPESFVAYRILTPETVRLLCLLRPSPQGGLSLFYLPKSDLSGRRTSAVVKASSPFAQAITSPEA